MRRNRMSVLHSPWLALALLAGSLAAEEAAAPPETTVKILFGSNWLDDDGDSTHFFEFRDLPTGVIVDDLRIARERGSGYAELVARDALQGDESYRFRAGSFGSWSASLRWRSTPHLFTRAAVSLGELQGDRIRIADVLQQQFEGLDTPASPGTINPALPALATDLIANAQPFDVGVDRDHLQGRFRSDRGGPWSFQAEVQIHRRDGRQPLSTGSYEREVLGGSGTAHTADRFRALGYEFGAPIDDWTQDYTFRCAYVADRWSLDGGYRVSLFDNELDAISFDNPWRLTDVASGSARYRFATGLFSTWADNSAHQLFATWGRSLGDRGRLTAHLDYSRHLQDQDFLPYTLNAPISTAAGFDVTDPNNLPVSSLDGQIDVLAPVITALVPLGQRWTLQASYRAYDYQNESEEIHFPGYAAFSESAWRPNIEGVPVTSRLPSFTRQNLDLEARGRLAGRHQLRFFYGLEDYAREERPVEDSLEHRFGLVGDLRFGRGSSLRLEYAHGDRTIDDYVSGLEYTELRQFDQAALQWDRFRARLGWQAGDRIDLGASYNAELTDYDETSFGLTAYDVHGFAIDLGFAPNADWSGSAFYALDLVSWDLFSAAKDDRIGTSNFIPANHWTAEVDDRTHSLGFGIRFRPEHERFWVDGSYALSDGNSSYTHANPTTPVKLTNALVFPWPDTVNRLHSGSVDLSYVLTRRARLVFRYRIEDYTLDDFQLDRTDPYIYDGFVGQGSQTYRFYFLNNVYDSYTVQVFSILCALDF